MSKTISAGLAAHLGLTTTTLALMVVITRKDGTVFRYTDHDRALEYAGDTYQAALSLSRSNVRSRASLQADTAELTGIIDDSGISEADLRSGLFNNAEVRLFFINWADKSQGELKLKKGNFGAIEFSESGYKIQFRDMAQIFQATVGDLIGPSCLVDLGSTKCGVRTDPPAWAATTAYTVREARDASTGSVIKPTTQNGFHYKATVAGTSGGSEPTWPTTIGATVTDGSGSPISLTWEAIYALTMAVTITSVSDRRNFAVSALTHPDDYFRGGVVTWTSGANNGLQMDVEAYGGVLGSPSAGQVRLMLPMPNDIAVGDTISIVAGCQKNLAACRDKFDNVENMRATGLYTPGLEEILRFPDAK